MKKASSMIELVIAIVVMGIAMMTLPLMLTRVQNNNTFAMQQEILLAIKTKIGDIITYKWDENSIAGTSNVAVLDVNNSDSELERFPDNNSTRRVGHINQNKRRKFFSNITAATLPGQWNTGTPFDDIDDFTGTVKFNAVGGLDYRFNFDMTTDVGYIRDIANYKGRSINNFIFSGNKLANAAGSTNIKIITVTVKGKDISSFKLQTYSSNIGGSRLLRRTYK